MKNKWDFDVRNDRVVAYLPNIDVNEWLKIKEVCKDEGFGKIIIFSTLKNSEGLREEGFLIEGSLTGFYYGDNAFIYSKYKKQDRGISTTDLMVKQTLKTVHEDKKTLLKIDTPYSIEKVKKDELNELAQLYKSVFPVYPTNIFDPTYLKSAMEKNYTFMVAKDKDQRLLGAASAMNSGFGSAEITDCAVGKEHRGKQLLPAIILSLENELVNQGIYHCYSITRAVSVGMNMIVKRLGYSYEGTLVNNCIISTGFEDMNIWTKKLK
ncbi:putative beta-lysine N-acetyltransferase [Evansella sp. AB-P1]|uniref:putative beta-lysine N-acetyltransferase n=1 Tax=Evansella sp. AB-P1 TaxID=3037653 RepID=UPI00241CD651|nr:putative beta-lysine N-acetyltransferase [Evansella sp. AB-P1]MDG5787514.1 putative beta-lysine N-acetyltransferase [Evansella sp. AB-P1]